MAVIKAEQSPASKLSAFSMADIEKQAKAIVIAARLRAERLILVAQQEAEELKRAAQLSQEDMQYMGPVRVSDVEQAQQKIVDVVRRLEDAGDIIIAGRGGEKEMVV